MCYFLIHLLWGLKLPGCLMVSCNLEGEHALAAGAVCRVMYILKSEASEVLEAL